MIELDTGFSISGKLFSKQCFIQLLQDIIRNTEYLPDGNIIKVFLFTLNNIIEKINGLIVIMQLCSQTNDFVKFIFVAFKMTEKGNEQSTKICTLSKQALKIK